MFFCHIACYSFPPFQLEYSNEFFDPHHGSSVVFKQQLMTKKRFIIMKITRSPELTKKKKKKKEIWSALETLIYLCMLECKKNVHTLAMLFKAHLSSIWWIFSWLEKMPNDDNGPDVHTAINNEVLHKKLSPTFL